MRKATLGEIFPDHRSGYWGKDAGSRDVDARVIRNSDVLPSGSVRWDEVPTRGFTKKEMTKAQVRAGDLLITTSGNCGRVSIASDIDAPTIASNFVRLLRVDSEYADPRFLWHQMRTGRFRAALEPFIRGTTIDNLSVGPAFASVELVLPPLEEQRRIAAVLDAADELRTSRRDGLAKLDTLIQAMLIDMFGSPGTNPRDFPVQPLIELVDASRPITYGILKPGDDVEGGVPYVRVMDMADGHVLVDNLRRTTHEIAEQYKRSTLAGGDLLLSIRGHVGRMATVPPVLTGANITQDTARLAITAAEPAYVLACLQSEETQRWMANFTKGAAVRGINLTDVKKMPVPVPPWEEQKEFAARAERVAEQLTRATQSRKQLDDLFASLQQRAFRGDL